MCVYLYASWPLTYKPSSDTFYIDIQALYMVILLIKIHYLGK